MIMVFILECKLYLAFKMNFKKKLYLAFKMNFKKVTISTEKKVLNVVSQWMKKKYLTQFNINFY